MKCILCGCTDNRACDGGCAWLINDPPICTTHIVELVVDALRWRALVSTERIVDFASNVFANRSEHVAFEFWGKSRTTLLAQKRTAEARKLLTKYADGRRKEGYR